MEITDRQLFDRYVEYKKSTVDKEKIDQKLINAFLRRKPHASKADRRKYEGSKEFEAQLPVRIQSGSAPSDSMTVEPLEVMTSLMRRV